nr:hypothetical protein SHINE37_44645 [Rhizobiaceae bacterium]
MPRRLHGAQRLVFHRSCEFTEPGGFKIHDFSPCLGGYRNIPVSVGVAVFRPRRDASARIALILECASGCLPSAIEKGEEAETEAASEVNAHFRVHYDDTHHLFLLSV